MTTRMLWIDDGKADLLHTHTFLELMQEYDVQICVSYDNADALRKAQYNGWDMVFYDIGMEKDTYTKFEMQTARRIRTAAEGALFVGMSLDSEAIIEARRVYKDDFDDFVVSFGLETAGVLALAKEHGIVIKPKAASRQSC